MNLFNLFKDIIYQIINWDGWDWKGWAAISAIVLACTFIFIAKQAKATKKFTKFSVMPSASFFLRSAKTVYNRSKKRLDLELPESMEIEEKLETLFIIRNNSKFPILFKVKIIFEINNKRRSLFKDYWKKPLPANFKISKYPDVVHLENFIKEINDIEDRKITAHIQYTYAPRFAPKARPRTLLETWIFDLEKYEWKGPAGIMDINIFLPGEKKEKNNS